MSPAKSSRSVRQRRRRVIVAALPDDSPGPTWCSVFLQSLAERRRQLVNTVHDHVREKLRRGVQLFAVGHHIFLWILMPMLSTWVPFYIYFATDIWWIMVIYAVWYVYDFRSPQKGARKWNFYRQARIWKHFADYFPIRLVKTSHLEPHRNYILGCHPHGVFSVGAFTSLCTEGTGFSELFPGLDPTILTLNGQFWFPFRREFGLWLGGCEASSKSLSYLLRNPGRGRLIGIVIGGAEEALDAAPGTHSLNLRSRRGFCRFALQFGASIVPSYSFGENDIYHQAEPNPIGSRLRNVQTAIKKRVGFCPPLFTGRSLLGTCLGGLFPLRRPVTTVVGAPIHVDRVHHPTAEQVDALHARYCKALLALFEEHKTNHGVPDATRLELY